MTENISFTSNSSKILKEYLYLYLFLFIVCILYNIFRIIINPNFELNYIVFLILGLNFLWTFFTNVKVRELTFNQNDTKLFITQKAFWGKEKYYSVNYSEISYELENNKSFLSTIYGKSEIILLKNKMELIKIDKSNGFVESDIYKIEKKLKEIKSACR